MRRISIAGLALSLMTSAAVAFAQGLPAPMQTAAETVDATTIATTLAEIRDLDRWKKLASSATGAADDPIGQAFRKWAGLLTRLSHTQQTAEADRLCAAIVELHDALPENAILAAAHVTSNAFIRDQFRVGAQRVDVAQFFVPERYYKDDPAILKLYRFSVYAGDNVILRYYLEHSRLDDADYYVLGKADAKSGAHYQVQPYGAKLPSYWMLRQRVIQDMSDPHPAYPASSKPHR